MIVDGRFRPTELRTTLADLQAQQKRTQKQYMAGILVVLVGASGLGLASIAGFEEAGFGVFCAIGTLIFGIGGVMVMFSSLKRAMAKVEFAQGFLEQVFDDLHPARKVGFFLDTTSYETTAKQYWSGRSRHGNAKYRYDDRWFRQRFDLIDGTVVIVERRADIKTRKGGIQKEKRRLYLKVRPNEKSFGHPDPSGLNGLVRQRIKEVFHDPPESIKVQPENTTGQLKVRVAQWDAPILPAEAFTLLETTLLYLHMNR